MKLPVPASGMQQPAFLEGMDSHIKWLLVTVGTILVVGAAHNIVVSPPASLGEQTSFAMCDYSLNCEGVAAGNLCVGIESWSVQCVDPEKAAEWRRVEAECGLDAQALCNADPSLSGMEWTDHPNATYKGKRCTEWAQQYDRVTLLRCDATFNDITQWKK